jgi:hypothetical protein
MLSEPKPWPAPLPDNCTLMRANDAVAVHRVDLGFLGGCCL